jgi:hypothetical protein
MTPGRIDALIADSASHRCVTQQVLDACPSWGQAGVGRPLPQDDRRAGRPLCRRGGADRVACRLATRAGFQRPPSWEAIGTAEALPARLRTTTRDRLARAGRWRASAPGAASAAEKARQDDHHALVAKLRAGGFFPSGRHQGHPCLALGELAAASEGGPHAARFVGHPKLDVAARGVLGVSTRRSRSAAG